MRRGGRIPTSTWGTQADARSRADANQFKTAFEEAQKTNENAKGGAKGEVEDEDEAEAPAAEDKEDKTEGKTDEVGGPLGQYRIRRRS